MRGVWAILSACGVDPTTVEGDLVVQTIDDLQAAAGFTHVGGDVVIAGTLLSAVELPALAQVAGGLRIWENPILVEVLLPALTDVDGDVSLYDNAQWADLSGFSSLRHVEGTLRLNRMASLRGLAGLESLESVGGLYLFQDDRLVSLDGLEGLKSVGDSVQLWGLPALERARFPALTAIEGKLDVFDCDALIDLGAPAMVRLRSFELHQCDAMTDLGAFGAIEELQGELRVQYNDGLQRVAGFPGLAGLRDATIRFNPALATMSDLAVVQVSGTLAIGNNRGLVAVDAPALQDVRSLVINGHEALQTVGLPSLARLGFARVVNNPQLPHCTLDALFDRVQPDEVECGANLEDGCTAWCDASPPP